MNENDLRVIKTKESIYNAFEELLLHKPFHKITLQELCLKARINKGTFYYHYQDINDLYSKYIQENVICSLFDYLDCFDTLLDDPVHFYRKVHDHKTKFDSSIQAVLQDKSMPLFKDIIIDGLIRRTYQYQSLHENEENNAKLYVLFNTMLDAGPRYDDAVIEDILKLLTAALFPKDR